MSVGGWVCCFLSCLSGWHVLYLKNKNLLHQLFTVVCWMCVVGRPCSACLAFIFICMLIAASRTCGAFLLLLVTCPPPPPTPPVFSRLLPDKKIKLLTWPCRKAVKILVSFSCCEEGWVVWWFGVPTRCMRVRLLASSCFHRRLGVDCG